MDLTFLTIRENKKLLVLSFQRIFSLKKRKRKRFSSKTDEDFGIMALLKYLKYMSLILSVAVQLLIVLKL